MNHSLRTVRRAFEKAFPSVAFELEERADDVIPNIAVHAKHPSGIQLNVAVVPAATAQHSSYKEALARAIGKALVSFKAEWAKGPPKDKLP